MGDLCWCGHGYVFHTMYKVFNRNGSINTREIGCANCECLSFYSRNDFENKNDLLKVVPIDKSQNDHAEVIFNSLRGRKFFAVSIKPDGTWQEHWNNMTNEQIVFGAELIKKSALKDEE